jgi:hypothetical protein
MKIKLLALTLALTIFATSCTTSWLTTFEGYLTVAAPVIIQIIEIIGLAKGVAVSPATIAKINADAAAVKTLVQSVEAATSANLPTTCSALNEGIATFAADVPTLEQIGQISNPNLQATIQDALVLVQATITEIEAPIASCQTSGASLKTMAAANRVKSPNDFVGQYNSIMKRHGQTCRVHLHSWPVRYITLGIMK